VLKNITEIGIWQNINEITSELALLKTKKVALAISWLLSESLFSFNQFCVLFTLNITDPSIAGVVIFGQKRSF
jgi:hypothetical protein